jgi:uroporphyrin-3 C-methyltransferase
VSEHSPSDNTLPLTSTGTTGGPAPAEPAEALSKPQRERSGTVSIAALIAVIVLAVAVLAWQWYDSRTELASLKQELAQRLAEGDLRIKESAAGAQEVRRRVRELEAQVNALEGGLAESQNQQVALEALYQQLSRSSDEWALSEIEQTLTIAAQQLQLAGNVKAALLALQTAENRLQRLDRPQLAPLRKVIERDTELLRRSPFVDVVGLAAKIDNAMEAVDALPLEMQQRPPAQEPVPPVEESNAFARLLRDIWQDLKSLVRIQTVERADVPLVDPGQAYFLRENLKLRLLSARLALLQRDAKTYRNDLTQAVQWLERYYDTRDRNTTAVLATLKQLAQVDVAVDVPDIAASLNAVRDYKLTREKETR